MADKATTTTAIVTGAGRGIGAAIAADLARRGYHVIVNYRRDADAAAAVVAGIHRSGGSAIALAGDVTDPDDVTSMVAAVLADRVLEPADIAAAVGLALDPALRPATGTVLRVDAGWSVLPGGPTA
ncbi:SDR family NAD(P)-dependent oxidoreductase [Frankia sp. AiPs1]|uniref:SDR family NAD(P)-dependent oxidoreductase n=1 Tax=Frankia sp. AiPs1 TaxID=573493 RepID=UPI002042EA95|nr:SDR family NAD(P)-dependent oxidoreductase [Frankia sp. AiPs1]MCM3921354.1 SDR family NAD(P)-dependent oxidoreductase [Frankia sp. AiPs1]